jgi:SAM-dependent methyltransferase
VSDFARFDQRHYPTLDARAGYAQWAPTYGGTVADIMDLALLDRLDSVPWQTITRVADLGCGSGRTAQWLRTRGQFPIDGVDLTPEMLDLARTRGLHHTLVEADVRHTGLPTAAYDLVTCVLVDEHLPDLVPLYDETARLLAPGGRFVIVGYHPYFIMSTGMPTHFDSAAGDPTAIETHLHLPSAHHGAARRAGLVATEMHEALVDDAFVHRKPSWEAYRGWPFSFAWVWQRS